jgi:hypothetical protein
MLLYTSEPELLRGVLRDVFKWKHVDAGDGWLIFALPPAELGVHPADGPTFESGMRHQVTFMCDDIEATSRELREKGITVKDGPHDEGWGITTMLVLPGGVDVLLYQPKHPVAAKLRGETHVARRRPGRRARKPATRSRGRQPAAGGRTRRTRGRRR